MELRREYLGKFSRCQYAGAIPKSVVPRCGNLVGFGAPSLCVEHIAGRLGRKSEHWSLYATTCELHHDFKHGHDTEARIAIWWFKWDLARTTGDDRHFDLEAIRDGFGFRLQGWIENKLRESVLPEWAERMGMELLEGL